MDIGASVFAVGISTATGITFLYQALGRAAVTSILIAIIAHLHAKVLSVSASLNTFTRGAYYHVTFPKSFTKLASVAIGQISPSWT